MREAETIGALLQERNWPAYHRTDLTNEDGQASDIQMNDLDIESVCGQACFHIINVASALKEICDPSVHDEIDAAAFHAMEVVLFG